MTNEKATISVAMRTRTYCGLPQRIEMGGAVSNSITSVAKDAMVLEILPYRADETTPPHRG